MNMFTVRRALRRGSSLAAPTPGSAHLRAATVPNGVAVSGDRDLIPHLNVKRQRIVCGIWLTGLIAAAGCGGDSDSTSDTTTDQTSTTSSSVASTSELIASWHRPQTCAEMLAAFEAAGLAESHVESLQGDFFGGRPGPATGDPCAGASGPLEHGHFFTEAGAFGSHDQDGAQVDDGGYEFVDDDTVSFPSHAAEFGYDGELAVNYTVDGDVVVFDVVMPDGCAEQCADAYAWAVSAFASGPWERGEVPTDDSTAPDGDASALALPEGLPGGQIAFRRFLDESRTSAALFKISTDGTNEEQVTDPPGGAHDALPDWSPDGTELAFQREYDHKPYEMYIVGADGRDERQVAPTCPSHVAENEICEETDPSWSPDGTSLAFSWPHGSVSLVNGVDTIEVRGIAVVRPDGSAPQLLTQTERPTDAEDESPVWSPDGSQIAFVRLNITAEPRDMRAVFVMNADGTGAEQITPWDLRAADIDWSPDGSLISFRSEESGEAFEGDLYTVHPDGSGLSPLTDNADGIQVLASSFSPDSEWLVFAMTGVDGQPDLFVMRTDGSDLGQLTATPLWESAPDWSPAGG